MSPRHVVLRERLLGVVAEVMAIVWLSPARRRRYDGETAMPARLGACTCASRALCVVRLDVQRYRWRARMCVTAGPHADACGCPSLAGGPSSQARCGRRAGCFLGVRRFARFSYAVIQDRDGGVVRLESRPVSSLRLAPRRRSWRPPGSSGCLHRRPFRWWRVTLSWLCPRRARRLEGLAWCI